MLRRSGVDARFERRENLHITVAFLGEVAPARLTTIVATLHEVRTAAFRLPLDRVGAFPNVSRPRVVWLGPARPVAAFARCAAAVRGAYAAHGFGFDQDARAHVTVGRIGPPYAALVPVLLPRYRLAVTALALFRTVPNAGAPRYDVLARQPLP